jgi:hypothetical protein
MDGDWRWMVWIGLLIDYSIRLTVSVRLIIKEGRRLGDSPHSRLTCCCWKRINSECAHKKGKYGIEKSTDRRECFGVYHRSKVIYGHFTYIHIRT